MENTEMREMYSNSNETSGSLKVLKSVTENLKLKPEQIVVPFDLLKNISLAIPSKAKVTSQVKE